MQTDDAQYDRVAQYLDGRSVDLTAEQKALAKQVRRDEAWLVDELQARPSPEALERARRCMLSVGATRRRRRRVWRWSAAVAAMILVAITLGLWFPRSESNGQMANVELLAQAYQSSEQTTEFEQLSEELENLAEDIALGFQTQLLQSDLDILQQELDSYWLQEAESIRPEG